MSSPSSHKGSKRENELPCTTKKKIPGRAGSRGFCLSGSQTTLQATLNFVCFAHCSSQRSRPRSTSDSDRGVRAELLSQKRMLFFNRCVEERHMAWVPIFFAFRRGCRSAFFFEPGSEPCAVLLRLPPIDSLSVLAPVMFAVHRRAGSIPYPSPSFQTYLDLDDATAIFDSPTRRAGFIPDPGKTVC